LQARFLKHWQSKLIDTKVIDHIYTVGVKRPSAVWQCTSSLILRGNATWAPILFKHYFYAQYKAMESQGHFTHEPRAMTMKLREPKRKCPKAIPAHLQIHVQWGTNQNVVFEIAARKLSRLPTLKAFLELKNWYFSTIFLPKHYH
jgi:hypothetical protein